MAVKPSTQSRHYLLSHAHTVPTMARKGLSNPTHTLSSHMVDHTISCPPICPVYASYLPSNPRCIFCLIPLRIPPQVSSRPFKQFLCIPTHRHWFVSVHRFYVNVSSSRLLYLRLICTD